MNKLVAGLLITSALCFIALVTCGVIYAWTFDPRWGNMAWVLAIPAAVLPFVAGIIMVEGDL